jgi:hypothetical protein
MMALLCLVSALVSANADDKDKLVGSWRVVAFKVQAGDSGETKDALGPKPGHRRVVGSCLAPYVVSPEFFKMTRASVVYGKQSHLAGATSPQPTTSECA